FGEGLLRFVADDPAKAIQVLEDQGHEVETREVLACQTPHHPGGLSAILKPLREAKINVDHLYPCIGTAANGQTVLILGVSDPAQARQALRRNWIIMIGDELYRT
ncbi:MAG: amino acid-binding protein, partial [Deltaproteobacteria bacterium]|nr:amino acid-binding protein [Deltaproteobacteria bacterium]